MDNKKQRFKIVISRKSNGKIHEFVLAGDCTCETALDFARNHFPFSDCDVLAVCPVDPPISRLAEYIVTFEDRTDTLLCSYRVTAENGIKAIDVAISDFKNDYHHGDIDVIGLERFKEL
jgi:hypothetical protein|nr:MAG TPA: hypothetical protein [Microviridae sp.]